MAAGSLPIFDVTYPAPLAVAIAVQPVVNSFATLSRCRVVDISKSTETPVGLVAGATKRFRRASKSCKPTNASPVAQMGTRTLTRHLIDANGDACFYADLAGGKLEGLVNVTQIGGLANTNQAYNLVSFLTRQSMFADLSRLFWGGDFASSDTFYNASNGLWGSVRQAELTSGDSKAHHIGGLSGTTLTNTEVYNAIEQMIMDAPLVLQGYEPMDATDKPVVYVCQNDYNLLRSFLTHQALTNAPGITFQGNTMYFWQYEVIAVPMFDSIYVDQADGNERVKCHMAILTPPSNLVLGADLTGGGGTDVTHTQIWTLQGDSTIYSYNKTCTDMQFTSDSLISFIS